MSFQRSPPQGPAGYLFANLFPRISKKPQSRRSGTHSQKKRPQQGENKAARSRIGCWAGGSLGLLTLTWDLHLPPQADKGLSYRPPPCQPIHKPAPPWQPPPPRNPPSAIPLIRPSPPTRHLHKTQTSPSTACDSNGNKGGRSRGTFPQFTKVRTSTGLNLYRSCIPRTWTTLPWRPFQLQLERKTTAEKQSGF